LKYTPKAGDKVKTIPGCHLSFHFILWRTVFPGIIHLRIMAAYLFFNALEEISFLSLACLQPFAWPFDTNENLYPAQMLNRIDN
jgi:hypothetical protein